MPSPTPQRYGVCLRRDRTVTLGSALTTAGVGIALLSNATAYAFIGFEAVSVIGLIYAWTALTLATISVGHLLLRRHPARDELLWLGSFWAGLAVLLAGEPTHLDPWNRIGNGLFAGGFAATLLGLWWIQTHPTRRQPSAPPGKEPQP
ncbi:hypothetical protein [Streptomyces yunnanensis]|uniref:Uncharacterized protein n=1 Tax=Streptomyces yunnanensis TaxID=156453 RepID=A0A9X8R0C5_9ACTN|nr:hypothetical protein [Streptomyces yunnanensis]SHN32521.1 hypothetical protein SAMN05216268_13637 [Streptomyces yunnanensis]